ncbi:uncharacterized protein [Amphiura filiformis]|uniref:uncharacterized protein n=1 Tax=Amphiura filiformis TaxID=82378 RepID=UPI003B224838
MEEPAPARATRSMTEIGEPPVNGMMETGENGPDEADANHTHEENRQIMLKRSSRVAKLKEQASLVKVDSDDDTNDKNTKLVTGLEDVPSGGDVEGVNVASSEINNDSIPERNNNSVIVPATIDVETLAIQSKSIPSFSPSTSAGSGADDESAGSSVDTAGTSPTVKRAQASILYNILTSQLKKSVKKNVNLSQVITDLPKVALNELAVKKTFKCRHCSRLFLKEYDFKQHERCHMVAEEKPFQCPQCGKRFASNSKLTIHMRIHTGEQPYQCDSCGKRFMTRSMARKHSERCNRPGGMRSKYSIPNLLETPKKKKQAVETTKPRVKTAVSEPGTSKGKESSKSSVEDKTYRCMNCYTICRDKQSYAEHVKQHKEDAALEGLYTCKKCGKCYERLYNLKKHMKLHDGSAPHACKLCGFRCLRKYTLQMHMEWHRNGGPKRSSRYKCKICRDSFQQASKLILHMKGHKVKKETVSKEMQRAESGPIAEWPKCDRQDVDGSRFAASCPHCKKHFTRKFDLLRHIKTHLKNLHHTCKYCDSTFMIKPNFIKHMHLHTSQDYHVCRSCGLVYNKKVQRHRQEKLCWFKTRLKTRQGHK